MESEAGYVRRFSVYGYCVVYKRTRDTEHWTVDQDDEYANLPAHYLSMEEALDRVEFLREKGLDARVTALMAESNENLEEKDTDE